MIRQKKIDTRHSFLPSTHPPPSPVTRQHSYCLWWVGVEEGVGGETDECQGAPRHFTFPLLQPDRAWITVNDSPPRPQNHLTRHRLSRSSALRLPSQMGPRWVSKLLQDTAGGKGPSVWGKRGMEAIGLWSSVTQAAGWGSVWSVQIYCGILSQMKMFNATKKFLNNICEQMLRCRCFNIAKSASRQWQMLSVRFDEQEDGPAGDLPVTRDSASALPGGSHLRLFAHALAERA